MLFYEHLDQVVPGEESVTPKTGPELIDVGSSDAAGLTITETAASKQDAGGLHIFERRALGSWLPRIGEVAMSTTVGSLGVYAIADSLYKDKLSGVGIGAVAILWSIGVFRATLKDLKLHTVEDR